jgi:hypothetical protein
MTEHLKILHWNNGMIHVEAGFHKWYEITLTVKEQRELLNYLLLNIEKHEKEFAEDEKRHVIAAQKAEAQFIKRNKPGNKK